MGCCIPDVGSGVPRGSRVESPPSLSLSLYFYFSDERRNQALEWTASELCEVQWDLMAMAKKKTKVQRKHRTAEERISDLEAQIREVKGRATLRELKKSVSVRRTLSIVKSIDKGMAEALEEDNSPLRHALADARRAIQGYAERAGVPLPKGKMPRGRRPSVG